MLFSVKLFYFLKWFSLEIISSLICFSNYDTIITYCFSIISIMCNHNTSHVRLFQNQAKFFKRIDSFKSASKLLKGSSINNTFGFGASALARATRCCCPPLQPCGYLFSKLSHLDKLQHLI